MNSRSKEPMVVEEIKFSGHPNIRGTHRNTIEITRVSEITRRADCIVGTESTKGCSDLSSALKNEIQTGAHLVFRLSAGGYQFTFSGRGSKNLTLSSEEELVLRRSNFVSDRTAAVSCDSAAIDIPRSLITYLQRKGAHGSLVIEAYKPSVSFDLPQIPPYMEQ